MPENELHYRPAGTVDISRVEVALDEVWAELRNDAAAQSEAAAMGVDLEAITSAPREEAIEVRGRASSFGLETIILAFLPLAVTIATDVWKKIILPRLEQRLGRGALTEEPR